VRLQIVLLEQDKSEARVQKRIEDLYDVIDLAIQSVKRIAAELRPAILDILGLSAAIEWQAGELHRATGIEFAFSAPETVDEVSGEVITAIFRIYQEVLTNIARHANASSVSVGLDQSNGYIELEVCDDGIGIDTSAVSNSESLGLLGMKERARQFNGTISIEKAEAGGTRVRLKIPWPKEGGV
jgi:signal transduction histidine kinase